MSDRPVSQRQLDDMLRKWQGILRLRDWNLSIQWATEQEMVAFFSEDHDERDPAWSTTISCAGTDSSNAEQPDPGYLERRDSRILLKVGAFESAEEVESTVVHEVLHSLLWPISPPETDKLRTILLEQIVLTLESALVRSTP